MEHFHGKNTQIGSKLGARTLPKELHRIRSLVSSPVKRRKKETKFVGKNDRRSQVRSYSGRLTNMFNMRNLFFVRAPQGHAGNNLDMSTFSHTKIEKGCTSFLYHFGLSRNEDSVKSGGLVQGGAGQNEGRKAVYFSLFSPLDQHPDRKHKPYVHLKNHPDLMFVLIWNRRLTSTKQRTVVSYVTTRFWPSSFRQTPMARCCMHKARSSGDFSAGTHFSIITGYQVTSICPLRAQYEVKRPRLPITIHRHPLASGPVQPVRFVTAHGEQTLRTTGCTAVECERCDKRGVCKWPWDGPWVCVAGRGSPGVDGNITRQRWLSCPDPDCAVHGGI